MFPIACIGFAVGSGLLIAIGRAGGETELAAGLSSRYTIFGAFMYVGLVFAASMGERGPVTGIQPPPNAMGVRVAAGVLALFVVLAGAA